MLISCNGCESKIKVPDAAAGKRVKCPKCATIIRVPSSENENPPEPPKTAPKPPPPEPPTVAPEEDDDATEKTRVTASKTKPSAVRTKLSRSKPRDDDEDEDAAPRRKNRDDDEDDDDEPRGRRRRDDDDDDDLDVRKRRRRSQGANGAATTSMVMGIVSVVFGLGGCIGCCCAIPALISLGCGITAVIFGHKTVKSPGSEGMAMTGLICGYIGIALGGIGVVMLFVSLFLNIGLQGMNMNRFNQPMFNPPPRIQPPPPPPIRFK